jgi:hypothetical protein
LQIARTDLEVAVLDLTVCPEPSCSSPAYIVDRSAMESTDGPIEHARTRCLNRHHFLLPVERLTSLHAADVPDAAADALPSPSAD